jgi:hypothetical protein
MGQVELPSPHWEALTPETQRSFRKIAGLGFVENFYLAGGTWDIASQSIWISFRLRRMRWELTNVPFCGKSSKTLHCLSPLIRTQLLWLIGKAWA